MSEQGLDSISMNNHINEKSVRIIVWAYAISLLVIFFVSSPVLADGSINKAKIFIDQGLIYDAKKELINIIDDSNASDAVRAKAYFLLANVADEEGNSSIASKLRTELIEKYSNTGEAIIAKRKLEEEKARSPYYAFHEPFTIKQHGKYVGVTHVVTIELGLRDPAYKKLISELEQDIREMLNNYFRNQTDYDLSTIEGKERLRSSALELVQGYFSKNQGEELISGIYLTSFIKVD